MTDIAIILVNYKDYAKKFLPECRDSLKSQTYPDSRFQTYIVDNASSGESYSYLSQAYPEAKILMREDGNYAAANNLGIQQAIEDGFSYFLVANMDTYFDQNCLENLDQAIQDNPNSLIQAKILLYESFAKNKKLINTIGNDLHYLGFGLVNKYKQEDPGISGYPEIGYGSGCGLILSKDIFETIGGYDESYYMYHDDIEISVKSKLAGFKAVLAPEAEIYHKYEFSRSVQMLYYMERNRCLFILSFYSLRFILAILPVLLMMQFAMLVYSILNNWFKIKTEICLHFLKPRTWWYIIHKRRELNKLKQVNSSQVFTEFKGEILFQDIKNPILKYIGNPVLNTYWRLIKQII